MPKLLTNGHREDKAEGKERKSEAEMQPMAPIREIVKVMAAKSWLSADQRRENEGVRFMGSLCLEKRETCSPSSSPPGRGPG